MKIFGVMIVAGCAMLAGVTTPASQSRACRGPGVNPGGQDPVVGKASSTPAKAKRK